MLRKAQKQAILARLEQAYSGAKTALNYNSPFELLVAVILSAQCTDERVNLITARLFPRLDTPEKMLALSQEEMEAEIRDCGLYRAKAKHILGACRLLVEKFGSAVPGDIDALRQLPGVGQKTANVVASIIYNVPAIAVDTHVYRVSHRLGMAKGANPALTEKELQRAIPREKWSDAHHWFIWHGRKVCKARKPLCDECMLREFCQYRATTPQPPPAADI